MIRKADQTDLDQIWQLHADYILDVSLVAEPKYGAEVQSRGFIVSESTKVDIAKRIDNSVIFNVYEENGRILGLIDINREIYFPEEAGNIIWTSNELKNSYFHRNDSIVLHYIAVDKGSKGKGISNKLFINAVNQLEATGFKDLFSIVTTGPLTNCPSIIWHTKMSFDRACVTMPIDLFGLKDYTSLLFHRKT